MEYLLLIEYRYHNSKTNTLRVELFATREAAEKRKAEVLTHPMIKAAFVYRNAE
jgi:hypothetical protein